MVYSLDIEVLVTSSKSFNPNISKIKFDKYEITTLPTIKESLTDTKENWLLRFEDAWKEKQTHSNPEKEADYILSVLSVLLESKIEHVATKSNNVQVSIRQRKAPYLEGSINSLPNIEEIIYKLNSLNHDLLRQFLRSCNAYRASISLIENNPTLSFFLLVTAIEAISGKVIKKTERLNFQEFVLGYMSEELKKEVGNKELLSLLIDQAWKMRCAFTHGGTSLSIGSLSAEHSKRIYVKHYIGDKEVFSPSIRWFEKVVRSSLLSFLEQQSEVKGEESKLPQLAKDEGVIYVKTAKPVQSGRVVTTSDLDLDFR